MVLPSYRIDGPDGAPVLLLSNSLGSTAAMWDSQVPALSSRFRVLRYDLRGHGASPLSPEPFDIGALGGDVLELLGELRLERVHFCGLSLGGMIGLWLGAHAPSRLDKLVLCNTAPKLGPAEIWNSRIEAVRQRGMAAIVTAVIERWFSSGFRDRNPAEVERARQMLLANDADGYAAACAAIRDMDQRADVLEIRVPTLIVAGRYDAATPPSESRWLAERIFGARLLELDAAHLSNVEAGPRFTASLLDFLTTEESPEWTNRNASAKA
ncbi:MAG: 3-oxoadipate enol-lactonase [Myxococcota bacterium]|nr:3-oxoadipate enol-lactonase [Myxococcota bacterium]